MAYVAVPVARICGDNHGYVRWRARQAIVVGYGQRCGIGGAVSSTCWYGKINVLIRGGTQKMRHIGAIIQAPCKGKG